MNYDAETLIEKFTLGDDCQADESAKILASMGEPVIPRLRELLGSAEEDNRWWAVRTFSLMKETPDEIFIKMLSDVSVEVRKCAALSIFNNPSTNAIGKLVELLSDIDPMMANLAANAIIAIGNKSLPCLLNGISNMEGLGRIEAYRAIACLNNHDAIPILMEGLEDDSHLVNYWAEEGLTKLGLDMVYIKND
ncbi:HEAT repeat domain-containing protein [Chloroflexota bacterium]